MVTRFAAALAMSDRSEFQSSNCLVDSITDARTHAKDANAPDRFREHHYVVDHCCQVADQVGAAFA